jgi:hypothetical protein
MKDVYDKVLIAGILMGNVAVYVINKEYVNSVNVSFSYYIIVNLLVLFAHKKLVKFDRK